MGLCGVTWLRYSGSSYCNSFIHFALCHSRRFSVLHWQRYQFSMLMNSATDEVNSLWPQPCNLQATLLTTSNQTTSNHITVIRLPTLINRDSSKYILKYENIKYLDYGYIWDYIVTFISPWLSILGWNIKNEGAVATCKCAWSRLLQPTHIYGLPHTHTHIAFINWIDYICTLL